MGRISGKFSRREVLQNGALASVFAASATPALAGGGRLRAGVSGGSATDTWDMRARQGLFMQVVAHGAVFENLTEIAADGTLKGELASHWSSVDAGLSWDIALRPDAVFHDGRALSARDVVATFEHHGDQPQLLAQIAKINMIDDLTLRFDLRAPNPSFLYQLAHPQLGIHPEGGYGSGVGTGLYTAHHFAPGARFLGRRVAQHWKGTSAGFSQEIEVLALETLSEQRAALKAGVIDIASEITVESLPQTRSLRMSQDIAVGRQVQMPAQVGQVLPLDNARFAERWWLA